MLKKQVGLGKFAPFYHSRWAPIIFHLLYADDIVIFVNGRQASLRAVSKVLKQYEDWFGLVVTSFTYLGVPIVSGRLLAAHFEGLINKVRTRLEG